MNTAKINPWRVGEEAVYVLGVEAVIAELGDDTVTLAGLTLPTRLDHDRGIRYLSMVWPAGDETTCNRDRCGPGCEPTADEEEREDRINDLERAIRDEHEELHEGPFLFCRHRSCQEVNR